MAPKGKAPQLIQHYVTGGDRSLKDWHDYLRKATFGAAVALMMASVVSLHWACVLIGLPDTWYAPVAWIVPLAMEVGMAAVASTATTIRKDPKPGREDKPGGYYLSLWMIFSFIMLLAQAANIGHAFSVIEGRLVGTQLPAFIPDSAIYTFAALFAALFPLGGTLLVHVSGFLRAHGTGARWIEDDAEVVYVEAAAGTPAQTTGHMARTPRAPQRTAPAQPAQPARATSSAPTAPARTESSAPTARAETRTAGATDAEVAARAAFDAFVAEGVVPDAKKVWERAGLNETGPDGKPLKNPATVRGWVNGRDGKPGWRDELEVAAPAHVDPIVAQVAADEAKAAETRTDDARAEDSAA